MANSHKLVSATDAHPPAAHASSHGHGSTDALDGIQLTTIELGHASDTTLARVSAGVVSIEGTNIVKAGAATGSGITMATARLLGRTTASTGAIEEITVGTGLSLSAGSLTATGGSTDLAGKELDYVAFTSPVSVTGTSEGAANTVVTGSSISYDGATVIQVEVYAPRWSCGPSGTIVVDLYMDSTIQGRIGVFTSPAANASAAGGTLRSPHITPSNASHTFTIKAWRGTADGEVTAGTGGTGAYMNGYIRVVRVTS